LHFTMDGLSEVIASVMVSSSLMIGVLAVTLRFAVRPLLADWAKLRNPGSSIGLERRLSAMEEDIRQLQAGTSPQLPAESLRLAGQPKP
jgi:hypothetical protein